MILLLNQTFVYQQLLRLKRTEQLEVGIRKKYYNYHILVEENPPKV